ncbi:MAG: hypothetical protein V8R52_13600 [Coprobacter fastidiosus]
MGNRQIRTRKGSSYYSYGTMATKMAIKDVARVKKVPLSESDRLTKLIPDRLPESDGKCPKINLKNCIAAVPELQQACNRKIS